MNAYETAQQRIRSRRATWLVTGVAGFIGSHLAGKLLELGQNVVGLDNFATGKWENLPRGVRFIEGDIRSLDTCRRACQDVDVVLHQAALGSVPRSIDDPVASTEANVVGFLNMQVAARDRGVGRFVYTSTTSTFGAALVPSRRGEGAGTPTVSTASAAISIASFSVTSLSSYSSISPTFIP